MWESGFKFHLTMQGIANKHVINMFRSNFLLLKSCNIRNFHQIWVCEWNIFIGYLSQVNFFLLSSWSLFNSKMEKIVYGKKLYVFNVFCDNCTFVITVQNLILI